MIGKLCEFLFEFGVGNVLLRWGHCHELGHALFRVLFCRSSRQGIFFPFQGAVLHAPEPLVAFLLGIFKYGNLALVRSAFLLALWHRGS